MRSSIACRRYVVEYQGPPAAPLHGPGRESTRLGRASIRRVTVRAASPVQARHRARVAVGGSGHQVVGREL